MTRRGRFILLLVLYAPAGALEAGSVLNFPRLSFEANSLLGIALVNPTDEVAVVTLTAYGTDGGILAGSNFQNPTQVTIPANQQASRLTSQLFGSGLNPAAVGWFQAVSSVDGVVGFFLFLNGSVTFFDGADTPDSAREIVFNEIRVEPGYTTEMNIVNPGEGAASVELRLTGTGVLPQTRRFALPAKGVARLDAASFFNVSGVPRGAYVIATSDVEIAGFEFVKASNGDLFGLNARRFDEQLPELNFPQMAVLGLWKTEIGLVNYSSRSTDVTITVYRNDGSLYGPPNVRTNPILRTLEAGGSFREDVAALFGFSGAGVLDGWIQVAASAPAINGYVTYGVPAGGSLAAVTGTGQGQTRAIFSHIATSQGFFNGIAILNAGSPDDAKNATVPANVRVLAIRPDGQILGSYDTVLLPGQRLSRLIDELIPQAAGQGGGLIWVKSDVPVNLTSLFGTIGGAVLANIPAQPALDSYLPDFAPTTPSPPDLSIIKSHSGTFTAGTNGVYTVTVQNGGSGPTTGTITVTDALPAGLSYVSGTGTGWSCSASGQTVTCTSAGPLAVSAASSILLTVSVAAGAVPAVTNTASVSTPGDTNSANNASSDLTTVGSAPVGSAPDLSLTKAHAGNFTVGVNGTYLISMQNIGSAATTGTITVRDTLPVGLGFVSATGTGWSCSAAAQIVTCSRSGSLAPGATSSITLIVSVTAGAVPRVTNGVTVSVSGDTNTANNSFSDPTNVILSTDLGITSQTNPGSCSVGSTCSSVTFTIVVNNSGPATASGATLVDTLPLDPAGSGATIATFLNATGSTSGVTCSASGATAVNCTLPSLLSGASATVSITMAIDDTAQGRTITNSASVGAGGASDPNSANNTSSSSMPVFPTNIQADLAVTAAPSSPASGTTSQVFNYTFTVTNIGPSSVQAVSLSLPLASGANAISGSVSGGAGSCGVSGATVTCSLGTMRRGVTRTVTITTRFSTTGSKTSTATVSFGAQTGGLTGGTASDPVSSNNTVAVTSTVN